MQLPRSTRISVHFKSSALTHFLATFILPAQPNAQTSFYLDLGCRPSCLRMHSLRNQIFAPAAPVPLPVLIVTGFLGSGKTTLMKRHLV